MNYELSLKISIDDDKNWTEDELKSSLSDVLGEYSIEVEDLILRELKCELGATVWVSPNDGESFHTGKLLGHGKNGYYIVFVVDDVTDFVDNPFENKHFFDCVAKVYTREEVEQIFSERKGNMI